MIKKDEKKISSSFEENIAYMDQVLPVKESFDIIKREMEIGGRKSFFYFIDGFVKDEAMLKLMDSFLSVTEEDMPEDAQAFSVKEVPYVEVEVLTDFDQVMRNVLSGTSCLFIEGYEGCFASIAGPILREVWMNRTRINLFVVPGTGLWRQSYLIQR